MLRAVAAAVVLLAGTVSGRREHIQVHTGSAGWEIPGAEFEETLSQIWATFQKRAKVVRDQQSKAYTPAESMLALFTAVERNSDYTEYPCNGAGKINKAGFTKMYEKASAFEKFVPDQVFKKAFSELFDVIGDGECVDKHVATNKLSARFMSADRVAVLKDVFESVTEDVGTPMKVGAMKCKDPAKQGFFFWCMHGDCEVKDESPVTFDTFKLYYNGLGMFIASDAQFELMLVNAWHMMGPRGSGRGGSYKDINTVNLRMRCYEEGEDPKLDAGLIVTLDPDCPSPRSDRAEAEKMAKEQHCPGDLTCFAKGCYF